MRHLLSFSMLFSLVLLFARQESFSQTCATCPGNSVTGVKASAFGDGNTASGNYSFVAGRNSMALQSNSAVIGSYSKASGGHSFVVGSSSFANGDFSYVFGGNSKADFDFSTAIGHNLHAMAGAFVLGQGRVDAILTNSIQSSLVIGFNSSYPTLFVSRTERGKQSGRVGIGNVTDPQAKLHIKADEGEMASFMLEGKGFKDEPAGSIVMTNGKDLTAGIDLKSDGGFSTFSFFNKSENLTRMVFTSRNFIFNEGSLGIGTEDPQAMLDVAGDAMVGSLTINRSYSLPSTLGGTDQFLRGDGTWAIPTGSSGGGSSYWLPDGDNIYFDRNVGIGTTPKERLTIDSPYGRPIHFHIGGSQGIYSNAYYNGSNNVRSEEGPAYSINFSGSGMSFMTAATGSANSTVNWTQAVMIKADGNVGIGTLNPDFKLTVAGGIHARDVKVTLQAGSDHVFGNDHRLAPLSEVEAFVKANKHLPGVAPESEMLQQGLDLGSFQIKLLEKIEELTLYIIQQQKEIEELKAAVIKQ